MRVLLGVALITGLATASDPGGPPPYRTGLLRWTASAAGLAGWKRSGARATPEGALVIDTGRALSVVDPMAAGSYSGHNFYNGGTALVGEVVGPETPAPFAFRQAIASWNALAPAGSWTETLLRARVGGRWTRWYSLGVWSAERGSVERHSVDHQGDRDGTVDTDTLLLKSDADAVQARVRLFTADEHATPRLEGLAVALSTPPHEPRSLRRGNPALWGRALDVPQCSQMVYPDGGEVWCSPTSVSMALKFWKGDRGACETQVKAAVAGVFDWLYDGHGNWPFNTAYAHGQGHEAYVARFGSLAEAEPWIAAGVPVVMSYGWEPGELDGAPVRRSGGHLVLLVGFDAAGNPIINDPAAPSDAEVRRTYRRSQVETLWLEHSGGAVYLIYPPGTRVPAGS